MVTGKSKVYVIVVCEIILGEIIVVCVDNNIWTVS